MKVTITAHGAADDGDESSHRFHFIVDDGETEPRAAYVTLRTARVIGKELADHSGLDALMRAMAGASPDEYGGLIGKIFRDK